MGDRSLTREEGIARLRKLARHLDKLMPDTAALARWAADELETRPEALLREAGRVEP